MKKLSSLLLALLLVVSLVTVAVGAEAYNPNGGCEAQINVKKADASKVVKDGIISAGEYEEYQINRDPDSTDLLFSWTGGGEMYDKCAEFLQNVHFYFSWDEVHGLNVAVTAQHLEKIEQTKTQPLDDAMSYNGMTFPGDEFISSVGLMFRCYRDEDNNNDGKRDMVFYRGVSKRTDNNQYLIGYYWDHDGYNHNLVFEAEKDVYISYGPNNTVTYELSVPLDVVAANGAVGDVIPFDLSVVGGSDATFLSDNCKCYIVSIGDEGFCTSKNCAANKENGFLTITNELIEQGSNPVVDNPDNPANPDDPANPVNPDNNDPSNPDTPVDGPADNNGNPSVKTGDVMTVLAVVSALSVGGVAIGKKRK